MYAKLVPLLQTYGKAGSVPRAYSWAVPATMVLFISTHRDPYGGLVVRRVPDRGAGPHACVGPGVGGRGRCREYE